MQVRTFANAVNIVCPSCASILDAKDPRFQIIQQAASKERLTPLLPLGARGKWKGKQYEVVGFQRRTINVDGIDYHWFEYLLFNPYAGYRYLTEYNGHWNDVMVCKALPDNAGHWGAKRQMTYQGRTFKHFQEANARTTYIAGEFPWQVRMNDAAKTNDFVAPPFILSSETTSGETTWSLGEYTSGKEIVKAFNPRGKTPSAEGIFVNQPNPYGESVKNNWYWAAVFLLGAFLIMALAFVLQSNQEVYRRSYSFRPTSGVDSSFVTDVFRLEGRPANVEVEINSDVDNNWTYFAMALINVETGDAYDFGREVGYYHGRDSDGNWSEGSRNDDVTLPEIPAGNYYLRVEPDGTPGSMPVNYTLTVSRDVPQVMWFLIALGALLVPPALISFRSYRFEFNRWQESDYAVETSSDDDDDDD
jgi:hypothetical protein